MSNERLERVEERIAWLERHITEQDKVMLDYAAQIALLRKELLALRDRSAGGSRDAGSATADEERPPHY
jgi:SlyX protein